MPRLIAEVQVRQKKIILKGAAYIFRFYTFLDFVFFNPKCFFCNFYESPNRKFCLVFSVSKKNIVYLAGRLFCTEFKRHEKTGEIIV